jgi:hypothetical protein
MREEARFKLVQQIDAKKREPNDVVSNFFVVSIEAADLTTF